MKRGHCRLWWPKQLLSCKPNSTLLFGWFVSSSFDSLDIVVAIAASLDEISPLFQSDLQGILDYANGKMPIFLQDNSTFSILGHCETDCSSKSWKKMVNQNNDLTFEISNGKLQSVAMEEDGSPKDANYGRLYPKHSEELSGEASFAKTHERCNCGCLKLDKSLELYRQSSIRNGNWIQLSTGHERFLRKNIGWMPKLHHMHLNGHLLFSCDVHVIIYEHPTFGLHHFSLSSWGSSEKVGFPFKRPKWVDGLHRRQPLHELDTVVLALNSATAAKVFFESRLSSKSHFYQYPTISMSVAIWHSVAMLVASISTVLYILLQFCHRLLSYGSLSLLYTILARVFSHTWKNVHIRSCQLLYWPIFLQGSGFRFQPSVEYAHGAALRKHSIWSSVAVDVLLGNVIGWALLVHVEAVYFCILLPIRNITNNLLRSGCVWLMGVPAGFKLNNELAGILGMISLNAIQIWSTLWFFMGFLFQYFIEGLAISGIILGMTIPAALCVDMLKLVTVHLSTLHWFISLIYSQQIQALASLWRLFRGRKWNPLRQRLDSYDYTVKQHVVGSLLFAPILLLLPTTSVFYIFFTILNTATSFICILIEVTISILHATPYAEIFLWMVRPKRFPSGVWFEILSDKISNAPASSKIGFLYKGHAATDSKRRMAEQENNERLRTVISVMCSNVADIGQIVFPHYKNVFSGISPSSDAFSAHRVLSGKRIPFSLQTGLPSTMPWMSISFREHWRLCHNSVLGRES